MDKKDVLSALDYVIGAKDVALLLDWSKSQVSNYTKDGRLPAPIKDIGGRPVWYKPDIEQFKLNIRARKKPKINL